MSRKNTVEDFHKKYIKTSHCWEWLGTISVQGYGIFSYNGKAIRAHRFSLYMKGLLDLASEGLVLHKCDNRKCVRPKHLYIGTYTDNNRDTVRRGRNYRFTKPMCVHGHSLVGENLYITPIGHRQCRICKKQHKERWKRKK